MISRLKRGIGITNEKLDHILTRIEDIESRVETSKASEIERQVREVADDLNALALPITEFFEDVETLRHQRHPDAEDFYRQLVFLFDGAIFGDKKGWHYLLLKKLAIIIG